MLTQARLKELLHYDPETGNFIWINPSPYAHKVHPGSKAGYENNNGYIEISISCKYYKSHRLAWLYIHGEMPSDQIDHINGIKNDNRISNLRQADNYQNCSNRPKDKRNTSGHKGIYWVPERAAWRVIIRFNWKAHSFGYFEDKDEAIKMANKAREELHKEFANHG